MGEVSCGISGTVWQTAPCTALTGAHVLQVEDVLYTVPCAPRSIRCCEVFWKRLHAPLLLVGLRLGCMRQVPHHRPHVRKSERNQGSLGLPHISVDPVKCSFQARFDLASFQQATHDGSLADSAWVLVDGWCLTVGIRSPSADLLVSRWTRLCSYTTAYAMCIPTCYFVSLKELLACTVFRSGQDDRGSR